MRLWCLFLGGLEGHLVNLGSILAILEGHFGRLGRMLATLFSKSGVEDAFSGISTPPQGFHLEVILKGFWGKFFLLFLTVSGDHFFSNFGSLWGSIFDVFLMFLSRLWIMSFLQPLSSESSIFEGRRVSFLMVFWMPFSGYILRPCFS